MKTVLVLSRAFFFSFLVAFAAYAQEESQKPPKPTAAMKAEFEKKIAALKTTCATDIANLCSDAEGPRVIGCLKHADREKSLTVASCQSAVEQIPDHRHPPPPPQDQE